MSRPTWQPPSRDGPADEPHHEERVERGAADIALLALAAVNTTVTTAKVVHDVIKDRPPKEEPTKLVVPPGVDLDE